MIEYDAATHASSATESEPLLVVFGWGNRLSGRNERWFLDRLRAAGYDVRAVQIPTNVRSFERDYLRPVRAAYRELGEPTVLGHSTGGLVAAHLGADRAVYTSPWWDFYGRKSREGLLECCRRLRLPVPLLPIDFEAAELGQHVPADQWAGIPNRISPSTVAAVLDAQEALDGIDPSHTVFCSLGDTVVGLQGVDRHATRDQVELYEGGHEPFSVEGRERVTRRIVAALED